MTGYRDSLNPAKIAAEIAQIKERLLVLSRKETEQFYLTSFPSAPPEYVRESESRPDEFRG